MTTTPENLGPAETIIQSLLAYTDHMVHNRPGMVVSDPRSNTGVRWEYVTYREEGDPKQKVVYRLGKETKAAGFGKKAKSKNTRTRAGVLRADNSVWEGAVRVGEYRPAGIYPEVATWFFKQVAEVWKMDNEFAARWASFAFKQEHRDLKVVLAAFMLVQNRKGTPITDEDGKVLFQDEDFRDVGAAMMLTYEKDQNLHPKLLLRMREVLRVPQVAALVHELGFGRSAREAFLGRWPRVVKAWLRYREENPQLLEGLVKAGFSSHVITLAKAVGYKPLSQRFFEVLRWKQGQAKAGHRSIAIGTAVKAAESWEGLTEAQVCQKISKEKPSYKRIVTLVPRTVGITRAVLAAAIEAGTMSNKDLIIATPTLEERGLLKDPAVKARWEQAVKAADDTRAANIARNVKTKEAKERLEVAADTAVQEAIKEVVRDMRIYVLVDISQSMEHSIERAKALVAKFVQAFPLDRLVVVVFNTSGRVVRVPHASAKGVTQAFEGIRAAGGTAHRTGVAAMKAFKPKDDEDSLFIFVGDEGENGSFADEVQKSGLRPQAFGFLRLPGQAGNIITATARELKIPLFMIDEKTFEDPYAIPRTLRALVAATPVGIDVVKPVPRKGMVDLILGTDLLQKPVWAQA